MMINLFDDPEDQDREEDEFENRLIDVDVLYEDELQLLFTDEPITFKAMEW